MQMSPQNNRLAKARCQPSAVPDLEELRALIFDALENSLSDSRRAQALVERAGGNDTALLIAALSVARGLRAELEILGDRLRRAKDRIVESNFTREPTP